MSSATPSVADLRRCATLVCAHVPAGTTVGLDTRVHAVGPKFMGFKLVSPGPHILSSAVKEGATTSTLLHVKAGDVVVFVWDAREEHLVPAGSEEAQRFRAAVARLELDAHLAPAHDEAQRAAWHDLSSALAADVISRIQPVGGLVHSETELGTLAGEADDSISGASAGGGSGAAGTAAEPQPAAEAGEAAAAAPASAVSADTAATGPVPSSPARGSYLYFSRVPGCGPGSRPTDRTAYAQDTSFALLAIAADLLKHRHAADAPSLCKHIVGELQASFVLFVFGQAYSGLEAWKRLTDVLARAEDLLLGREAGVQAAVGRAEEACAATPAGQERYRSLLLSALPMLGPAFWEAAFSALAAQLRSLPPDTFSTDLTADNFLQPALAALVRTVTSVESGCPGPAGTASVRRAVQQLVREWEGRFGLTIPRSDRLQAASASAAAAAGQGQGHSTREALLAALAEEGDGELPVIVDEDG